MIQENELLTLLLVAGFWFFIIFNRKRMADLQESGLFLAAFGALCAGWLLTTLEELFLADILNTIEHVSFSVGSILFALWVLRVFSGKKEASE